MLLRWPVTHTHVPSLSCKPAPARAGQVCASLRTNSAKQSRSKHKKPMTAEEKEQKKHRRKQWQRQQRQHKQPQKQPWSAVEVRRGDLAYGFGPWHLTFKVTTEQLRSHEEWSEIAEEGGSDCEVDVKITVSAVGAGYYLTGTVSAWIPLYCEHCSAVFTHPVKAKIAVWLDASLGANDEPDDPNCLPFPRSMYAVGLDQHINDAMYLAMPYMMRCGRPDCTIRLMEYNDSGSWTEVEEKDVRQSKLKQKDVRQSHVEEKSVRQSNVEETSPREDAFAMLSSWKRRGR